MFKTLIVACLVATAAACGGATTQVRTEGYSGAVVPRGGRVPAGTTIWASLEDDLSVRKSRPGDQFTARVSDPVVAPDGEVLIPGGTRVFGHVTQLRTPRGDTPGMVVLALDSIEIGGVSQPLQARIVETDVRRSRFGGIKPRDALIGAGIGAVLGGVIEGGTGAVVGGLLGAAAGSAISLGLNRDQAELEDGTKLAIQLDRPVRTLASIRGRRVY